MAVGDNIQVNEGTGKRLGTSATYTENSLTVRDEKFILGEPYVASYFASAFTISTATVDSHIIQLMAGSTNKLRIRRIAAEQRGLASASSTAVLEIRRLTTAGTGGTSITPALFDPADSAAGATSQSLPTAKGTEGGVLFRLVFGMVAAEPVSAANNSDVWFQLPNQKPLVVANGTSNGLCVKNLVAITSGTVNVVIEFDETPF